MCIHVQRNVYSIHPDPYIKVNLICEGERLRKWKTSVKKNTLMPVFNESFEFDTSALAIDAISLYIWVMSWDRLGKDNRMGMIHIGDTSLQESGRKHWQEAVQSQEHMTSLWHTIVPQQISRRFSLQLPPCTATNLRQGSASVPRSRSGSLGLKFPSLPQLSEQEQMSSL